MAFDSIVFLFRLLPLVLICYFLAPKRGKNLVLIFGSLIFYAWGEPLAILALLCLSCVNYGLGCLMGALLSGQSPKKTRARAVLVFGAAVNLFVLFFAGYYDGLALICSRNTGISLPLLRMGIPAGIFIYVLRAVSFLCDVYRKDVKGQMNFLDFLLYLTFFLQYPAGALTDYRSLREQLKSRTVDVCAIQRGCVLFVRGLSKKVLLGDHLKRIWERTAVSDFSAISLLSAWVGILAFSLSMYYEFAGISEMAEGLAAIFGFPVPKNFDHPYVAVSVTDFWKRWYASLGEWFRRYVYEPLTGTDGRAESRPARCFLGMAAAWALLGLWSGFGLHYVIWGLWFGIFLGMEKLLGGKSSEIFSRLAGRIYTWIVVLIGWVIYAFDSFHEIRAYLFALCGINSGRIVDRQGIFLLKQNQIVLVVAMILCMPVWKRLEQRMIESHSGYGVSVQRFLEKLSVVVLLFLCISCMN